MELGEHAIDHLRSDTALCAWYDHSQQAKLIPLLPDGVHTIEVVDPFRWQLRTQVVDRDESAPVEWRVRGPRVWPSPYVHGRMALTRFVTVVIKDGELVTLWAGEPAPLEPADTINFFQWLVSVEFWNKHGFVTS